MVLRLKTRESRSLPGLQNATYLLNHEIKRPLSRPKGRPQAAFRRSRETCSASLTGDKSPSAICSGRSVNCQAVYAPRQNLRFCAPVFCPRQKPYNAGWSSPVARQAHNLKAAGSNPAPATKSLNSRSNRSGSFLLLKPRFRDHTAPNQTLVRHKDGLEAGHGRRGETTHSRVVFLPCPRSIDSVPEAACRSRRAASRPERLQSPPDRATGRIARRQRISAFHQVRT
jgi:hypothetical protein